jgi:hypothetical protein
MDAQEVTCFAEDLPYVVRVIGERVSRVALALDHVQISSAIGMDQAAEQPFGVLHDDPSLPRLEVDGTQILHPHPVLREQARPVLPVGENVHAPRSMNEPDSGLRKSTDAPNRLCALVDDPDVTDIEAHAQLVDASWTPRDPAVPQVHPQEIRVPAAVHRNPGANGAVAECGSEGGSPTRRTSVPPIGDRLPSDLGLSGDRRITQAARYQVLDPPDVLARVRHDDLGRFPFPSLTTREGTRGLRRKEVGAVAR